jgi:hypothetical protein
MRQIAVVGMFVLVSLARAQSPSSDRWAQVGTMPGGAALIDTTTMAQAGVALRYVWTQLRFESPQQSARGMKYNRSLERAEYNCATGEGKSLEIILYLDDVLVETIPIGKPESFSPAPGSIGERLYDYACGKRAFQVAGDPPAIDPGWRVLSFSGGETESTFSLDTSSMVHRQSIVTAWTRKVFPAAIRDTAFALDYNEVHTRVEFNCASGQSRTTAFTLLMNERVVHAFEKGTSWHAIEPGSSSAELRQFVCKTPKRIPARPKKS